MCLEMRTADLRTRAVSQGLQSAYLGMIRTPMVKISDLLTTYSLEQVDNDDYNVFAMEKEHPEEPEYVSNTYLVEQGYTNTTPNSSYMSNNIREVDQDDDLEKEHVKTDDPNITMEKYIRLEEEKAHRHGKMFNWETATYGKIWDNEDVHDIGCVETEFPTIVFNDTLTSKVTLSCEPTVSSLNNNEIDFRISFDESDDEDCTVILDKNSFSYKIISVNNLKTDSENDNDKINMPLLPSPKPTVSCFDDLDFFNDFENEFPAIVYNNAQMSKSDLLTELILNPNISMNLI
ncbi:hypothetical protein Tco_0452373 [Tanacetum coccineum]